MCTKHEKYNYHFEPRPFQHNSQVLRTENQYLKNVQGRILDVYSKQGQHSHKKKGKRHFDIYNNFFKKTVSPQKSI